MSLKTNDTVASLIDDICLKVNDVLVGEPVCIFLTGSITKDEIGAYQNGDVLEVYSDVDLWVVIPDTPDLDGERRRVRRGVSDIALAGEGYRFFAAPDVGVFTEADLAAQRARPGTLDIAGGKVLQGEPELPIRIGRAVGRVIDNGEALYLLENRLVDLIEAAAGASSANDTGSARFAAYVALKACADVGTALLVTVDRFAETRRARADLLKSREVRGLLDWVSQDVFSAVDRSLAGLDDLNAFFAGDASRRYQSGYALEILHKAWFEIAGHISARRHDQATLVDWRCHRHRRASNMRELYRLSQRFRISRTRMLAKTAALSTLSPVETLRLVGLIQLCADGAGRERFRLHVDFLDALSGTFGFTDGDVFQRARAMLRATT